MVKCLVFVVSYRFESVGSEGIYSKGLYMIMYILDLWGD